jgi:hypothetical protein
MPDEQQKRRFSAVCGIWHASCKDHGKPGNGRTENTKVQGNKIMTYEAKNVRNAFFAVTVAFFASAILMAGAVGPAVV